MNFPLVYWTVRLKLSCQKSVDSSVHYSLYEHGWSHGEN